MMIGGTELILQRSLFPREGISTFPSQSNPLHPTTNSRLIERKRICDKTRAGMLIDCSPNVPLDLTLIGF